MSIVRLGELSEEFIWDRNCVAWGYRRRWRDRCDMWWGKMDELEFGHCSKYRLVERGRPRIRWRSGRKIMLWVRLRMVDVWDRGRRRIYGVLHRKTLTSYVRKSYIGVKLRRNMQFFQLYPRSIHQAVVTKTTLNWTGRKNRSSDLTKCSHVVSIWNIFRHIWFTAKIKWSKQWAVNEIVSVCINTHTHTTLASILHSKFWSTFTKQVHNKTVYKSKLINLNKQIIHVIPKHIGFNSSVVNQSYVRLNKQSKTFRQLINHSNRKTSWKHFHRTYIPSFW